MKNGKRIIIPRDVVPPRMTVRDRFAPHPEIGARFQGWMEWQLINREGNAIRGGQQSNMILDQGLDDIATRAIYANPADNRLQLNIANYVAVGTDGTAPAQTDTGLGVEIDRTGVALNNSVQITRTADGVYEYERTYEFDFAEANGNLAEWGMAPTNTGGATDLFSRELFRDGGGTPEVVTKTVNEKLRITYVLEITMTPVVLTPASFTLTNIGVINGDYVLHGGPGVGPMTSFGDPTAGDVWCFSGLARGAWGSLKSSRPYQGTAYIPATNNIPSQSYAADENPSTSNVFTTLKTGAGAYTPGSYSRTGSQVILPTSGGNFEHQAIVLGGAAYDLSFSVNEYQIGYKFFFDAADYYTKDNLHELDIGLPNVTWSR